MTDERHDAPPQPAPSASCSECGNTPWSKCPQHQEPDVPDVPGCVEFAERNAAFERPSAQPAPAGFEEALDEMREFLRRFVPSEDADLERVKLAVLRAAHAREVEEAIAELEGPRCARGHNGRFNNRDEARKDGYAVGHATGNDNGFTTGRAAGKREAFKEAIKRNEEWYAAHRKALSMPGTGEKEIEQRIIEMTTLESANQWLAARAEEDAPK